MLAPIDVAANLVEAVRGVKNPEDLDATLREILVLARDSIDGIEHLGIVVAEPGGTFASRVATDSFASGLDQLQCDLGEGPCLQVLTMDSALRMAPGDGGRRWPRYLDEAVQRGVCSQLVVRLHAGTVTLGALSAYSVSSDEVPAETERLIELFAAHASVLLGNSRQVENLTAALASRQAIGLALGLVMERHSLGEDAAFAYLTRISATTETKLREVATGIIAEHQGRLDAP